MAAERPLPRSLLSFYISLFRSALTEAYGVVDAFLTFIAFAVFLLALFNKELAHQLETQWQGLSRWYSIVPLGALFTYRLMKANYAHFEEAAGTVDDLQRELQAERERVQQPDVALVWDWPEDQKKAKALLGSTEKLILVHNRSDKYVYNVEIAPIKLRQELAFEKINEIAPGAQHLTLAHWNGRSSATTNYVYFFGKDENEQEASRKGWVYKKLHNRGIGEYFLKVPMVVTYQENGVHWKCDFEFNYDIGDESVFVRQSGGRTDEAATIRAGPQSS